MKKIIIILVGIVFITGIFSGCQFLPSSVDIGNLSLVRMIAIDKGDTAKIKVTLSLDDVMNNDLEISNQSGGQGAEGTEAMPKKTFSIEGNTLDVIEQKIQKITDKTFYSGHLSYYFISEEAAREGLKPYIDYFCREENFSYGSSIYITPGKAGEFLDNACKSPFFLPDYIDNLNIFERNYKISFLKITSKFKIENCDYTIPIIENDGGMEFKLNRYAVFRKDKMITALSQNDSLVFNIIQNSIVRDRHEVEYNGSFFGLEIKKSKCKIKVELKTDFVDKFTIDIEQLVNIGEMHTDSVTDEQLDSVIKAYGQNIKGHAHSLIDFIKSEQIDILDFSGVVNRKNPHFYNKIKNSWYDLIKDFEITVNVNIINENIKNIRRGAV